MADVTQPGAGQTPLWSDTGWPHVEVCQDNPVPAYDPVQHYADGCVIDINTTDGVVHVQVIANRFFLMCPFQGIQPGHEVYRDEQDGRLKLITDAQHVSAFPALSSENFVGERTLQEDGFYRRHVPQLAISAEYGKSKLSPTAYRNWKFLDKLKSCSPVMGGFLNKSGPLTPERDREQAQAEWQQIQAMLTSGSIKLSPADCVRLRELVEAGLDRRTVRKEERIVPAPQPVVDVRRGRAIELD